MVHSKPSVMELNRSVAMVVSKRMRLSGKKENQPFWRYLCTQVVLASSPVDFEKAFGQFNDPARELLNPFSSMITSMVALFVLFNVSHITSLSKLATYHSRPKKPAIQFSADLSMRSWVYHVVSNMSCVQVLITCRCPDNQLALRIVKLPVHITV